MWRWMHALIGAERRTRCISCQRKTKPASQCCHTIVIIPCAAVAKYPVYWTDAVCSIGLLVCDCVLIAGVCQQVQSLLKNRGLCVLHVTRAAGIQLWLYSVMYSMKAAKRKKEGSKCNAGGFSCCVHWLDEGELGVCHRTSQHTYLKERPQPHLKPVTKAWLSQWNLSLAVAKHM